MNRYKREALPKKVSVRRAAEIYHFKEKDLEDITEDDLKQPCHKEEEWPQEDIGTHTRACKVEIEWQKERPPGCTWDDVVQRQEAFNASPSEWIHQQRKHRYNNYEDRTRKSRRHREEDEEEEEDEYEEEDEDENREK